jgi:RNA polymerase sigma-70 factor (ECF subfamily)
MMPTQPISATPALTWLWVRAFVVAMTQAAKPERTESRATSREKRRVQADVAASVGGDGAAYSRVVERYQAAIAQRMARFTRDANVVEELTHDVFVEAYFSLRSYRGDAPFEHWLQRIATRVAYRHLKRTKHLPVVSFDERTHDSSAADDVQANDIDDERIAAVLEQLPPRDRLVLTLLYIESRSVAEAAEVAGWSQAMVKVQAYRARQKFHKLYSEPQSPLSLRRTSNG